jgi:hypothetical protein
MRTKFRNAVLAIVLSTAAVAWALEKQAVTDQAQTFRNTKTWTGDQNVLGDAGFAKNVTIAGNLALTGAVVGAGGPVDCYGSNKAVIYDAGYGTYSCNTFSSGVASAPSTFGAYYVGYPGDNASIAIRHDTDAPAMTLKGVRFIATVQGTGGGSDVMLLRDVVAGTTHATCNIPCAGALGDNVTCTVNQSAVVAGARLSFVGNATGSCSGTPKPAGNLTASFVTP